MNQEEQKQIVCKYIEAYNNFDIETMLSLFDSNCRFEKYNGDKSTVSANGLLEFSEMMKQGKNVYEC